ncbi:MAG: GntR family transcriptional regulator [Oceanibaculum nanhaiense]|uniref:GntR family transcriptional regulator n=1 Tax=Oceanibaculum nanhaiense TaxID=1909734 RepID=UPI0025A4799F|nr:GntR family transcriptional regulator [Oceanibaculum nanhaiense]MDM7945646.1 GntR family transcriptional regulator [Oceanibaculum nanhaiense]
MNEALALDGETPQDRIVQRIEEDIVFGRLHPRERLVEEALAERFGVKRHIVREALADLERRGLIERFRNRGAMVKAYTPEEVEQLYAVRALLETSCAEMLPLPMDPARLAELEALQDEHDSAVAAQDLPRIFRLNVQFHRVLYAGCGNPYLAGVIDEFAQKTHAIRFYSVVQPETIAYARDDHRAILKAIRDGDRQSLMAICRRHLMPSKEAYIDAYRRRFGLIE